MRAQVNVFIGNASSLFVLSSRCDTKHTAQSYVKTSFLMREETPAEIQLNEPHEQEDSTDDYEDEHVAWNQERTDILNGEDDRDPSIMRSSLGRSRSSRASLPSARQSMYVDRQFASWVVKELLTCKLMQQSCWRAPDAYNQQVSLTSQTSTSATSQNVGLPAKTSSSITSNRRTSNVPGALAG